MVENKDLDCTAQKAFIEGINGCVEHVLDQLSHYLIPLVLHHYHLPPVIINYIIDIYSKLQGRVVTKNWESEVFKFKAGSTFPLVVLQILGCSTLTS